jgi:hypothetical protein
VQPYRPLSPDHLTAAHVHIHARICIGDQQGFDESWSLSGV